MYKPKESFLKLNNKFSYMGGLSSTNTLKRYSQPIFETNNPPPKKVKMESSNINIQFNEQMKSFEAISKALDNSYNNLDDKIKFGESNGKMELEVIKENNVKSTCLFSSNDKLGYLEGITKNI
jgi:hypothetical protein